MEGAFKSSSELNQNIKMKNLLKLLFGISLLLGLSSCEKLTNCVNGSGEVVTEYYSVSYFDEAAFFGSANVELVKGDNQNVIITGQQNVLDVLRVEVKSGELQIGKNNCFRGNKRLRIIVETPHLESIRMSGSGNVVCRDAFSTDHFRIDLSGSCNANLAINTNFLRVESSGSAELQLGGWAHNQDYRISGSGEVSAFNLLGHSADVDISGSGICQLNVSDHLNVKISGSGTVYYKSSPRISTDISGSGKLLRR